MKLLVIGSTGRTGKHILEQGIQRGHEITAFTRRPQELEGFQGLKNIVQGDGVNLGDIKQALAGLDAVILSGGNSDVVRNLVLALPEMHVRRIAMTSSISVAATRPRIPVALAWMVFRSAYADLARSEGMLQVSGLDWTIVRATMLTDKPYTGEVHIDFNANVTGGDWSLTRADYAMALLDAIENPSMIGKTPNVVGVKDHKKAQSNVA